MLPVFPILQMLSKQAVLFHDCPSYRTKILGSTMDLLVTLSNLIGIIYCDTVHTYQRIPS